MRAILGVVGASDRVPSTDTICERSFVRERTVDERRERSRRMSILAAMEGWSRMWTLETDMFAAGMLSFALRLWKSRCLDTEVGSVS